MLSRFIADYGIVFVLLLLCILFSVTTLDEQHPTGGAAGKDVASQVQTQTGAGATILIVTRETQEDREFAVELSDDLTAHGRKVLGMLTGQPTETRSALEKIAQGGARLDVLASVQATGAHAILDSLRSKYTSALGQTLYLTPQSYRWPNFLKASNLLNITNQIVIIAIIAIGMTMVIITGGIDLSVGSLMAFSAVVAAVFIRDWMGGYEASSVNLMMACLLAIGACGAMGMVTGIVVTRFAVPPFIATLSMMLVASGLALRLSRSESIAEIPASFKWLGAGADIGNIPNAVVLMALLYVLAHVIMSRTIFGRYIYAVGGNAEAARLSGVPVTRVVVAVYITTAILAGLGGVILASQLKSSNPNYGFMYELDVIAAVVVGGTSLAGGEGKMFATLLGAFLIAVIKNGMNMIGIESANQRIVLGLVILIAVLIDKVKKELLAGKR